MARGAGHRHDRKLARALWIVPWHSGPASGQAPSVANPNSMVYFVLYPCGGTETPTFERSNTLTPSTFHARAAGIDGNTFSDRQRHFPRHAENGGVAAVAARSVVMACGGNDFAVFIRTGFISFLAQQKTPTKRIILFSSSSTAPSHGFDSGSNRRFRHRREFGGMRAGQASAIFLCGLPFCGVGAPR